MVYDSSECKYLPPLFSILQSQISNEKTCISNFIENKCNNSSVSWLNCHQCDKVRGRENENDVGVICPMSYDWHPSS